MINHQLYYIVVLVVVELQKIKFNNWLKRFINIDDISL